MRKTDIISVIPGLSLRDPVFIDDFLDGITESVFQIPLPNIWVTSFFAVLGAIFGSTVRSADLAGSACR
jgi:hypothetical protein